MSTSPATTTPVDELTQVLYHEAQLLDEGRFEEWIGLLADDLSYVSPVSVDVLATNDPVEPPRHQLTYFNDSADLLRARVAKLRTGAAQTENPPSRTVRLVSNVQVDPAADDGTHAVRSAFVLYRHRRQREIEIIAGHRRDQWRPTDVGWRLCRREVRFAANVLPTHSLSLFY